MKQRAKKALSAGDRSRILTERRNPRSARLHALSAAQIAELINREDQSVARAVRAALPAIVRFIRACEARFVADAGESAPEHAPGRLIYIGAGTSGRLGVLDASEAPPTFHVPQGRIVGVIAGGDGALRRSSEGREDEPDGVGPELRRLKLHASDTVLGIAAGGTTPYVLGGLALARRMVPACLTGLMVCTPIRKPAGVDHLIVLRSGPEVLTGSTRMKAGTATKMALNIISTTLMVRAGRVHDNLMVDVRATNVKLRDRAVRIVVALTGLSREESQALLERAGWSVKTAAAMQWLGADRAAAEGLLRVAGQRLSDLPRAQAARRRGSSAASRKRR
jgi:N-acetylmuramic acid 6-phosphate etherase